MTSDDSTVLSSVSMGAISANPKITSMLRTC